MILNKLFREHNELNYISHHYFGNNKSYDITEDNTKGELIESAERSGINSYAVEILACVDAINKGLIQCPEMPWHKTACIASLNDKIRKMI